MVEILPHSLGQGKLKLAACSLVMENGTTPANHSAGNVFTKKLPDMLNCHRRSLEKYSHALSPIRPHSFHVHPHTPTPHYPAVNVFILPKKLPQIPYIVAVPGAEALSILLFFFPAHSIFQDVWSRTGELFAPHLLPSLDLCRPPRIPEHRQRTR